MSAGCTVRCPICGNSTRIEIAEIDRLRTALATMTSDRDRYQAKAAAAETLYRPYPKHGMFDGFFGGRR